MGGPLWRPVVGGTLNTASLIRLFERLSVDDMRGLAREFDRSGTVSRSAPTRPSINEMARTTVDGLHRQGLIGEELFDRLAEMLIAESDEVERVRCLWEIQWQADVVVRTAREDVETTARTLVENVKSQLAETEEALRIAVQHASHRARELNEAVERASAIERELSELQTQAGALLDGIRTHEREAQGIIEGMRELTATESASRERRREEEPDLFDTGDVKRPQMNGLLWPVGATITVTFLDGSDDQHELVRNQAREWTKHANVDFEFTADPDAKIRIAFDPHGGSWAYVGTNALAIEPPHPTMNLAWVEQMPETALHEFGHVLGLIHEWQSPNADISWDVDAVRAAWPHMTDEQIQFNVVGRKSHDDYPDYREFDPESIMMFSIPSNFLLEGDGFTPSKQLTESDRAFIAQLYPDDEGHET